MKTLKKLSQGLEFLALLLELPTVILMEISRLFGKWAEENNVSNCEYDG